MLRPTSARLSQLTRTYLYDVDVHGQLFLTDTKIRNFTSCFKDPAFLSFFYTHLRRNTAADDEAAALRREGYEWLSLCGRERSFLRPADTPLVFQKLSEQGLTYAGAQLLPFNPTSLLTDTRGYLYHPSPTLKPRRSRSATAEAPASSQFGAYSLLRSSLVLDHFAQSLDLDSGDDGGGSFEWQGERYGIGRLGEGMALRRVGSEGSEGE